MGGQTSYYGFYFFASNNVVHVMNALSNYYKGDDSLVFEEEGKGYIWKQSNGDNSLYFEKIVDKFFYYEQHY